MREIRTLGLTSSPSEKFAKLLLSWSPNAENATEPAHLKLMLTPEEIAEMIGTTREKVSRVSDFKKKQLLQLKSSTLIFRNKPALERIVNS
jgi:CRP-like cAMP-binding protein